MCNLMFSRQFVYLQLLSFLGLALGLYFSPDNPIYPFAPSAEDWNRIKRAEMEIVLVISIFGAITSIFGKYLFKLTFLHAAISTLISGIFVLLITSLRLGALYLPSPKIATVYFFVTLVIFGVVALVNYVAAMFSKNHT